jgi:hypothetical protein
MSSGIDHGPSEQQKQKLCELMAWAFIEIRSLCWSNDAARSADLADALHNLPREMYGGGGGWNPELCRAILESYQEKHSGKAHRTFDYVAMFDEAFPRRSS